jgi:hypothetical protein
VYHLMGNHCLAAGRDELLKVGCVGKQSWVRPHSTSSSQSLLLFACARAASVHACPQESAQSQAEQQVASCGAGTTSTPCCVIAHS